MNRGPREKTGFRPTGQRSRSADIRAFRHKDPPRGLPDVGEKGAQTPDGDIFSRSRIFSENLAAADVKHAQESLRSGPAQGEEQNQIEEIKKKQRRPIPAHRHPCLLLRPIDQTGDGDPGHHQRGDGREKMHPGDLR